MAPIKLPVLKRYTQIGGDVNPGRYGALLARCDGSTLELIEIQPVREYVGESEAAEVGFPFWSREASYDLSDLQPDSERVQDALGSCGPDDLSDFTDEQCALVIAEALFRYGHGVEESNCGWARDVLPAGIGRVKWWSCKYPRGASFLADEDRDFRREVPKA